jgi:hypothetical protein
MLEWNDYEISPRNSEIISDCDTAVDTAPVSAHRRRLGCSNAVVAPAAAHRRMQLNSATGATTEATEATIDATS